MTLHIGIKKRSTAFAKAPRLQTQTKALNGIQWEVAHPLTLNYGVPITSTDETICVSGAGTPYIGIIKGVTLPMYGVPSTLTHMVAPIEAIGASLFNANG